MFTKVKLYSKGIGGRTMSAPLLVSNGQMRAFDLGGQFVSPNQVHLMDLLKKLNIRIINRESTEGKIICDLDEKSPRTTSGEFLDAGGFMEKLELVKFFEKVVLIMST